MNPLQALRIPGGCDDCDAYQTIDARQAPIYRITVHHDDPLPHSPRDDASPHDPPPPL